MSSNKKTTKIIIADDHEVLRLGLTNLLKQDMNLDIVDHANNGIELLEKLKTVECDIVLMDLSMPKMNGLQAMKEMKKLYPKIKIVVLTVYRDLEHLKSAMKNGAAGYVLKNDAYTQLVNAIKKINEGEKFVSPSLSSRIVNGYFDEQESEEMVLSEVLTKSEYRILKLITKGLSNKDIARQLSISVRTVETHRAHILSKLGLKNTASLVKYALSKGLVKV